MSRRLLRTILRQVAFLLAPETLPLAHQLAPLSVDLHLGICSPWRVPLALVIAWPVVLLRRRRTCHATCNRSIAGGGIVLLVLLGPPVVVTGFKVRPSEDAVLGAFFVHGEDARLPFRIVAWDCVPNIGDDAGVVAGDPFSHCFYQHRAWALVVELIGQLGLSLHLSVEELG